MQSTFNSARKNSGKGSVLRGPQTTSNEHIFFPMTADASVYSHFDVYLITS